MPGLLPAALRAQLERDGPNGPAFFYWEFYFPGGVRRYSDVDIAATSVGYMAGKVVEWAPVPRRVAGRENTLELLSTGVTLEDTDRSIAKLLEGSQANAVGGAAALLRLGHPYVPSASWATVYGGILTSWRSPRRHHWSFGFERNVFGLKGTLMKVPILPSDWPGADPSLYAHFVPRIYGIHDSRGSTNAGFIPCTLVDKLLWRYLVAQGWVTVDRVYKNGALLGSGFTIVRPTINGRLYTVIDFTSPNNLDDVVAADVTGYESVGNGSGSLITGVNCIKHALSNFLYADYQGGNWLSDAAAIDVTGFSATQTFLTDMGWQKASRWLGGVQQASGLEVVNEFCKTFQLYPTFTRDGKLAILFDDHRTTTLWHDAPRLAMWDQHTRGGEWELDYDRDGLTDRINVSYVLDSTTGEYVQSLEVRDLSVALDAPTELALPWLHSSLT